MATRTRATIIYDGDCPFCARYTQLLALREVADVELVNAREHEAVARELQAEGFDLDSGMVAVIDGRRLHGAEAMRAISTLVPSRTMFTRLNRFLLRSPAVARALYPMLRLGRSATLRILGRDKIASPAARGGPP